jgi:hypothetical protein
MSISRKQDAENNWLLIEEKFVLQYHLVEEKRSLKNHWLQKKEIKDQARERSAKIDDIAKFVTKYINSRKSQSKG